MAPPREKRDRAAKPTQILKDATDAKAIKQEPKVKSEPKVGDKRKPGGQPGPRGSDGKPAKYKKGQLPPVLKGADAPTVDLISPDKGTRPRASPLAAPHTFHPWVNIEISLGFQSWLALRYVAPASSLPLMHC